MKKLLIALLGIALFPALLGAYPGQVQISSPQGEIPVMDDMFRLGPSTGFPVPFTLDQSFDVPSGAAKTYGTIAPGPCQGAVFVGATPGYTSGGYPTPACSWIMWEPAPAVVTMTVQYTGRWIQNYIALHRWNAWEGGGWVAYCLIGEPDEHGHCPGSIYFEAQLARVYLPIIIMKGYP